MHDVKRECAQLTNLFMLYEMEREAAQDRKALAPLREQMLLRSERVRAAYRSRTGRLQASELIERGSISMLEDALADEQDMAALFALIESLRARTLLDQMDLRPPPLGPQIRALERAILQFAEDKENPGLRELRLASRLELAHPEFIEEVERLLREENGGMSEVASTTTLDAVMSSLQAGEALIEYCMPAHSHHLAKAIWAMVLTRDHARIVRLVDLPAPRSTDGRLAVDGAAPVDFVPASNLPARLAEAVLANSNELHDLLQEGYEMLISRLFEGSAFPAIRHLIIVPDGVLHMVPFAALRSPGGTFLGEQVSICVVPSASTWHRLQRTSSPMRRFLGLANPTVPGQASLEYAEMEVQEICRLLRNRDVDCAACFNDAATESALKRNIEGRNMLHIAAHGALATAQAFDTQALLLARSADDDGPVQASEFRELDLRHVALTVLSVCDSATYRFGAGNELHGLTSAILIAGAHNVMGTLWPVNDEAASQLMIRFYTYVVEHGAAEALRRARGDLIRQGADVRDWASFVVVGPGRRADEATDSGHSGAQIH